MPEVHDPTSWLGAGATGAPKDIIVVVYLYWLLLRCFCLVETY